MKRRILRAAVVRGDGLGRKLGFPTANLKVPPGRVPPFGVYRVSVRGPLVGERPAVCSVGVRPSIAGARGVRVEVHIPGFFGSLYGRRLEVAFLERLRGERKFATLAALKAQIRRDIRRSMRRGVWTKPRKGVKMIRRTP